MPEKKKKKKKRYMLFGFLILTFSTVKWPPRWTAKGTWRVPYTNLSNPILIVQEPNRQYTNELNGLLQIWNTGPEERIHRKTVVAQNQTICYGWSNDLDWDIEMVEFLPDLSEYTLDSNTYTYKGRLCKLYIKKEATAKPQTWKMYIDIKTGYPVAYVAQAISIHHSHYDLYILEFDEFIPEAIQGVWNLPSMCINPPNDPYPGATYNLFFPSKSSSNSNNHLKSLKKSYLIGNNKFSHLNSSKLLKTIKRLPYSNILGDDIPQLDLCTQWKGTPNFSLPKEFSWKDIPNIVGPPRDQVSCGSCWAFGTAELLESQFAIKTGIFREISTNQIMDCTWDVNNFACQGGEVGPALTSLKLQNAKIAFEKDYPYLGVSGICGKDFDDYAGKIISCFHVERKTSSVMEALYRFGPLAISINVIEEMLFYNKGVFDEPTCTGTDDEMLHIVQLTGWKYIDNKLVWEVKNSWSTYWGDEGYIYIQAENQEWNCGVTTRAVGVVIEV